MTSTLPDIQQGSAAASFPLNLGQAPDGLRFGSDALLLAAYARRALASHFKSSQKNPLLVELGCGDATALLGLLTVWPRAQALGIDINADFILLARQNAARLAFTNAGFYALDLRKLRLEPGLCDWREKACLVLANPPWRLPSEGRRSANKARNLALWADADSLAVFSQAAAFFLKHGGQFCCISDPASLPRLLEEMGKNQLGLREILPLSPRAGQKAIRLLLRAQKNAQPLPELLAPLILHKDASNAWSQSALNFCHWLKSPEEFKSGADLEER